MQSLQEMINEVPEGGILYLDKLTYKENIKIEKNITIVGVERESDDVDPYTEVEGAIEIFAKNPKFENIRFDFNEHEVVVENVCPVFEKCRFGIYDKPLKIEGPEANPSFISCIFCGEEDCCGIYISKAAKGFFKSCYAETFCAVCVQDKETNPTFIDCSFGSLDACALYVCEGAKGFFEDSEFISEMYNTSSVSICDSETHPVFKKCNIYGFSDALGIWDGAKASFEDCSIGGNSANPQYDCVVFLKGCSVDFVRCDFRRVNTTLFRKIDANCNFVECLFKEEDE